MFADNVEIEITAGKGGDGKLGFRHEKYREMGGPDGGDGGRGASVIAEADHNLNTLSYFRNRSKLSAPDGDMGGSNRKHGKAGVDLVIKVPVGTLIYDVGEDRLLHDLTTDGQQVVIARGGRGGFGNAHFKASTRQAPRIAEVGELGERRHLRFELKLVADVGLVGLPNAGKSTLLSVISNAKPEIGDYPFTTLVPNLGVVDIDSFTFLVADIPGLIEGASHGKGLGDDFLRHIERTAVIFHLIDANSTDAVADYHTIQQELRDYQVDLTTKPQIIVLTKTENMDPAVLQKQITALKKVSKSPVHAISAQAHQGLDELLRAAKPLVEAARTARLEAEAAVPVIDETSLPDVWRVERLDEGGYRVMGERIEGFARRTNYDSDDGLDRLREIMRKMGISRELEKQGVEPGDPIRIGASTISWR